jgi:hypothetical protein
MPPDHATPLATAARRKRDRALERAHAALRDLDRRGETIGFQAVARHAAVSRQGLYKQPELRAEIERLRDRHRPAAPRMPDAERTREASLRQRNTTLLAENQRLRQENAALRDELALLYGERREGAAAKPTPAWHAGAGSTP